MTKLRCMSVLFSYTLAEHRGISTQTCFPGRKKRVTGVCVCLCVCRRIVGFPGCSHANVNELSIVTIIEKRHRHQKKLHNSLLCNVIAAFWAHFRGIIYSPDAYKVSKYNTDYIRLLLNVWTVCSVTKSFFKFF